MDGNLMEDPRADDPRNEWSTRDWYLETLRLGKEIKRLTAIETAAIELTRAHKPKDFAPAEIIQADAALREVLAVDKSSLGTFTGHNLGEEFTTGYGVGTEAIDKGDEHIHKWQESIGDWFCECGMRSMGDPPATDKGDE
jgi:hypothetical protein